MADREPVHAGAASSARDTLPAGEVPGVGSWVFRPPQEAGPVVVIGAGLMGAPTGLVFALAGYDVRLVEIDPKRREGALARVATQLLFLVSRGLVDADVAAAALPLLTVTSDLEAAVAPWSDGTPPALVVEAVFEDLALKQETLAIAESMVAPEVLVGSITSGLSITAIAKHMRYPERFCGIHFWNPPHLIPLVEVIFGEHTGGQTVERVCRMLEFSGKRPVVVQKDVPGFIGIRLLHALQKEAMAIVAAGVASAEDVDLVCTQGFGRRLGVIGPLAVCDLAGLDLVLDVDSYLIRDLDHSPDPCPLLEDLVAQGHLGVKTLQGFHPWTEETVRATVARRDAALIRALQVDREENPNAG
jgi:3-hydroxybutyryl-CoA dehydrogenase